MSTIAISDVGTLLCVKGENDKYSKLIWITSAPATIEVTTLESKVKQYISDRPGTPSYEFEANYTKENYEALISKISLTDAKGYLIVYQDGSGEKFTDTGEAWKKEVSLGEAVKINMAFAVQTHEYVPGTALLLEAPTL